MLTATILYNAIAQDYTKSLSSTAKQPSVERATQYFLANIGKVTSASQLVNNSQLYNYVMTAFGLQDMSYAKALIVKVLNGGATSSGFAASMNDPRYTALVTAFDFAANGATTTSSSSSTAVATTVNNYNQQTLETQTGQENQGAQMALYFGRMANTITSPYSILADPTLLQVFQTAFNLPVTMSLESIDTQAQQVSQLLNISKLQDPTYLNQFLQRFTASYDAQNPPGSASSTPTNALLVTSAGISSNLLLSLANLKLGGS
ncbi:MAG: DUF1217 domain-containing protein [Methylovirgula sp.]